ncbi:YeiH family protein [Paenibacillus sacheonensis]|uniref:Putative sulfate exporter family transporter n=1 Tax=Paenibacillus sacheonensis TaxID=742054 RepID=A0A7X4YS41_9BACL|nr:putative sulfate exporter family transporter [Paenibacillus sacheonensis]MBM7566920.1 putative integral membrane protein (TIGR00698 family) [Paenibacillus sacheonensis]NBC71542.1 putative sulfate exporter family transporter [Paenibacillus sacheonensis]
MSIPYSIKPLGFPAMLVRFGRRRIGGIAFTFLFAAVGWSLSSLPGLHYVGQMACAILLAVGYRHFLGYPMALQPGIQFASKHLLRFAIILYGLKLNILDIYREGLGLLARDAVVVLFAIGGTLLLAKWLRADPKLSLLLGIGTGICGAAAIAAVSPILRSKDEDTAVGAGLIALVGTLFAVAYTLLRPLLGLTDRQYGVWAGTSLHEIAHAALAASPAGQDALALALLAKLGRVFLLVPLCLVLVLVRQGIRRRKPGRGETEKAALQLPWFLLGFALMSLLGSSGFGHSFMQSQPGLMNGITTLTTFLLTMAMVGLGLNVNLRSLGGGVLRSLGAMLVVSLLLSAWTYLSV